MKVLQKYSSIAKSIAKNETIAESIANFKVLQNVA